MMGQSYHRPIVPPYYIEDCQILALLPAHTRGARQTEVSQSFWGNGMSASVYATLLHNVRFDETSPLIYYFFG